MALYQLVLNILAGKEAHALRVVVAQLLKHLGMRAVFAPQRKEEHAGGVRVARKRYQQLAGLRMVGTRLRAVKGMREVVHALKAVPHQILSLFAHGAGDLVHAANRRDDPQLVARGGATVGAAKALEGLGLDSPEHRARRMVLVIDLAGEIGLDIMRMQPATRLDIAGHMADGQTVLDYVVAGGDCADGHLVALRNVLCRRDIAHTRNRDRGAGGKGLERHDHVIGRIDLDGLHV